MITQYLHIDELYPTTRNAAWWYFILMVIGLISSLPNGEYNILKYAAGATAIKCYWNIISFHFRLNKVKQTPLFDLDAMAVFNY